METHTEFEKMLREALDPAHMRMKAPALERMDHLRRHVAGRKRQQAPETDLFGTIASFLNMKIRLYHAVAAVLIVWCSCLLLRKEPGRKQEIIITDDYAAKLAAVNNATVLSSIQTYILRK